MNKLIIIHHINHTGKRTKITFGFGSSDSSLLLCPNIMARIQLDIPEGIHFRTSMHVQIGDINYGNHLSNDAYLRFMHEARVRFFLHFGFTEMNIEGRSVIMGDTAIVYKEECRYGDEILIEMNASDFGTKSFDFYYRFIRQSDQQVVCESKTRMICFDYQAGQSVEIPSAFRKLFD